MVDDNTFMLKVAEKVLGSNNWDVETAAHGQEALDRVKARHDAYEVVLMDLAMPVMDGLQATKLIRDFEAANNLRPLKIIALTGDSPTGGQEADQRSQSFSAGCNGFWTKPVDWPNMEPVLKQTADESKEGNM